MTIEIIQEITRSIIQLLVIPTVLYIVMEIVKTYFKRKNIKEEKYINLLDSLVVAACFRNESGSLSSVRMGSN